MRILFLITRAERGGAQSHLLELVRGLGPEHEILLVSGEDGPLLEEASSLGARIQVIPSLVHPIRPLRDLAAIRQVLRIIRSFAPDLLHAHSSKAGAVGRIAAALSGVPSVFTAHGWAFTDGAPAHRKLIGATLEKLCAPLCRAIIVVSEYDRHLAHRFGIAHENKLVVIHNGVPARNAASPAGRGQRSDIAIVMTARFAPPKDQLLLIRALKLLPDCITVRFLGAGAAMASCEQAARSLGVRSRVSFLGDRGDVAEQLADADIFALCSNYEGLPISIIEAMRAGLPVVATDVGGVGELVEDGHNGFLVPKGSVEILAERIRSLAVSPGVRLACGNNGRAKFERQFSSDAMLRTTLNVYGSVLSLREAEACARRPSSAR